MSRYSLFALLLFLIWLLEVASIMLCSAHKENNW